MFPWAHNSPPFERHQFPSVLPFLQGVQGTNWHFHFQLTRIWYLKKHSAVKITGWQVSTFMAFLRSIWHLKVDLKTGIMLAL